MILPSTPSQTIGPFFALALPWPDGPQAAPEAAVGRIHVWGHAYDGRGEPVADALVETWQADPAGCFVHPAADVQTDQLRKRECGAFRDFARSPTAEDGRFELWTRKPGRVPGVDGRLQAPHVDVSVFARGLLQRLVTRIYFGDEPDANKDDPRP